MRFAEMLLLTFGLGLTLYSCRWLVWRLMRRGNACPTQSKPELDVMIGDICNTLDVMGERMDPETAEAMQSLSESATEGFEGMVETGSEIVGKIIEGFR